MHLPDYLGLEIGTFGRWRMPPKWAEIYRLCFRLFLQGTMLARKQEFDRQVKWSEETGEDVLKVQGILKNA